MHRAWVQRRPAEIWKQRIRNNRYLILLLVLIAALIVQSIDRPLLGWTLAIDAVVGLSALAVAIVVFEDRRSRIVSFWWGGIVVLIGWTRHLFPDSSHLWLEMVQRPLVALFMGWAAALILRDVFKQARIRTDDVVGAVAGYLLAAAAWANLFILLEILHPGSFQVSSTLEARMSDWHGRNALFNYFSLATLTSVGYGDISPVRGPMTIVAMLETVFGQFYIAVVVAHFVGIRLAESPRSRGGGHRE